MVNKYSLRHVFSERRKELFRFAFSMGSKYKGKSREENPQKLTQLSPRSHPRHLMGKRTAQKDAIKDITSHSQVNSYFPYMWSPACLTINIYFLPIFIFIYNKNNDK